MGWETVAKAKKASLLNLIPKQWQLNRKEIPSTANLRDVTEYICKFLHPRDLEITNSSVGKILENIRTSEWSSLDVTRAFCHRAALAHQLVSFKLCCTISFPWISKMSLINDLSRRIACLKYASLLLRSGHNGLTITFSRMGEQ